MPHNNEVNVSCILCLHKRTPLAVPATVGKNTVIAENTQAQRA